MNIGDCVRVFPRVWGSNLHELSLAENEENWGSVGIIVNRRNSAVTDDIIYTVYVNSHVIICLTEEMEVINEKR